LVIILSIYPSFPNSWEKQESLHEAQEAAVKNHANAPASRLKCNVLLTKEYQTLYISTFLAQGLDIPCLAWVTPS
jgi:hypothetical protein